MVRFWLVASSCLIHFIRVHISGQIEWTQWTVWIYFFSGHHTSCGMDGWMDGCVCWVEVASVTIVLHRKCCFYFRFITLTSIMGFDINLDWVSLRAMPTVDDVRVCVCVSVMVVTMATVSHHVSEKSHHAVLINQHTIKCQQNRLIIYFQKRQTAKTGE